MPITVHLEINREFAVAAGAADAFEFLAHVPHTRRCFPDLERLVALGGQRYRWEIRPIGTVGIKHRVIYGCRYAASRRDKTVEWQPLDDIGNGRVAGRWRVATDRRGARLSFHTEARLLVPDVPLPFRLLAAPYVEREFLRRVEGYHERVQAVLGET
ncbi:MAG: hypothetical protein HYV18_00655 [Gammaproteobacteria bacterium]|nr:hypothetical protein [Gammaproteobacteria bacterium]